MEIEQQSVEKKNFWLNLGAVVSAIGASACCVGPLLFLSLGIGGAWMATLSSMTAVRPFFIVLTIVFIFAGFINIYGTKNKVEGGTVCRSSLVLRKQRTIFWIGSVSTVLLLTFTWYAPYFL